VVTGNGKHFPPVGTGLTGALSLLPYHMHLVGSQDFGSVDAMQA